MNACPARIGDSRHRDRMVFRSTSLLTLREVSRISRRKVIHSCAQKLEANRDCCWCWRKLGIENAFLSAFLRE